jgi:uncharacterized damage-inducible protein DinB
MVAELANYLARIEDLHGQISGLIADLSAEALNWRPLDGSDDHAMNSLAVLTAHVAGAEHFWIAEVIGRRPPRRDRPAEFATVAINAEMMIQRLQETLQETRDVSSALGESDLNGTRRADDRDVPVRWCMIHVIDHTSLHLGHMQMTYQLWSGGQSHASPPWFERLSPNRPA